MAQAPPQYTYTPPPNELPYYNALFTTADANSSGYLSGPDAVSFLSLSKLPVDLLKQIWTMADQPASNTLDAGKFHVAVRLIQLFQNGKKPVDLALNLGEGDGEGVRPPFFEGVNVQAAMQQQQQQAPPQQQAQMGQQMGQQNVQPPQPSPPMQPTQPPQPQLSASPQRSPQLNAMSSIPPTMNGGAPPTIMAAGAPLSSSTALAVQDPYSMTPQEFSRYEQIFPSYAQADPNDGKMYVGGGAAVELFSKSGMDNESLKTIWAMVDDPIDNKLDSIEFSIAMHLIVCITKKGLPTPPGGLPASLQAVVAQARGGAAAPQMQPGEGGIPSPDKMQQHQMNGGMQGMPPPQQMGQMGTQQPQMGQPGGMQQMQQGMQQMGIQQTGSFGGNTAAGGQNVDDAFAGMSNEPVVSVDEYSTIGGIGEDSQPMSGGMSTMGGLGGLGQQTQPSVQEVATPEPSPQPAARTIQPIAPIPAPPMQQQQQQVYQPPAHQPQQPQYQPPVAVHRPPSSPRAPPKSPRSAAGKMPAPATAESTAELAQLREAHQKLQAEVISLRAKAASVGEEEQETQKEIASLAGEIGKLGLELSELKEEVMEAKVKLAESVGVLKIQMEKKGSLEVQVSDYRSTHEALNSATEAVTEANDLAMAQQARAVAAAAAAKEEAESVIPEPPAPAPVDTADLFSWDAPAPAAPIPAAQETVNPMSTWGSDAHSVQSTPQQAGMAGVGAVPDMTPPRGSVASVASMGSHQQPAPAPAPWGSSDNVSVAQTVQSNQGVPAPAPQPAGDNFGMYSAGNANPNPYGMGMGAPAPIGGGYEMFGGAMGAPPAAPQPAMTPMGGANHYDAQSVATPSVAPNTVYDDQIAVAHSQPEPQLPPGPPSPSKAEIQAFKTTAVKAEKDFQSSLSLVRSISVEVNALESAAKQAETVAKSLEGKKKKGSFSGGKKKAKKEYEQAIAVAEQERKKVKEAKVQLAAAEREADKAKQEMEEYRQSFEQMELEAATAASYMSAQQAQQQQHSHQRSDSHSVSGQSAAGMPPANQYPDPFGGGMAAQPAAAPANDPYGMGLMGGAPGGGGDYANPFAM